MSKSVRQLYLIIYIIATLGILVSGYLWYEYTAYPTGGITCDITGTGCDTVRTSEYSSLWGIELPVWGVLYYLAVWGYSFSIVLRKRSSGIEPLVLTLITACGFVFSAYLTYLEAFVIVAWCQWCLASAGLATALFIACLVLLYQQKIKQQISQINAADN